MFSSWIHLLCSVLQSQAYKQPVYVAAGSCCKILSVEQVTPSQVEDSDPAEFLGYTVLLPMYIVEAALVGNINKKVFLRSKFILPSRVAEVSLQSYRTAWDSSVGAYWTTWRPTAVVQPFPVPIPASKEASPPKTPPQHINEELRAKLGQVKLEKAEEQLAEKQKELAEREEKLKEREDELTEREKRLRQGEKKLKRGEERLAEENKKLAEEKLLADHKAEDEKALEEAVDHIFDRIDCPFDIPRATSTFNGYFFRGFGIAVGSKASRIAKGLSVVLRKSANSLHRS